MENGFGQITSGATQHAGPSNSQIMAMATSPVASGPTRMSTRPRMPSLAGREPQTLAELALAKSQPATPVDYTYAERTTRSKTQKPKLASKVKLKLGEKATQGIGTSFLGPYDRELDTDDEEDQDLVFEEQFILKMPEGEDCDQLRTMVQARTVTSDVWFRFNDARRGTFHIGNSTYASKLVDLPCVIESQKTLDNKQMFKVADIWKALVIGDKIETEDDASANKSKAFRESEYVWPHGITPPLKHVRKRRFRKRISRATIEDVEQQIERLLDADAKADQVDYKVLENVNPDLSDSEFDVDVKPLQDGDADDLYGDAGTPEPGAATPGGGLVDDGMDFDEGEAEGEGDDDEEDDLAAELERALAGEEESGEDDEDDEDEEEETEDELDEDEDAELTQTRRLLHEEIQDLEAAVQKKVTEIASSGNPLIKRRFEDALKKLKADLEAKRMQVEALTAKPQEDEGMELEDDNEDLFADDDEEEEEENVEATGLKDIAVAPTATTDNTADPTAGPVVIQLTSTA